MTVAEWGSTGSALVVLVLLAVVSVDRNRIKHRLDNAEGAVSGLGLDLQAMAERVAELQSYLGSRDSWAVDATAPAALADPRLPDRWLRAAPAAPVPTLRHDADPSPVGDAVARTGRGDVST